ncbi:MAG: hypothetical protein N4A70_10875 [Pelagimonas sp.]|nr:hypothetical protein [Pelagimonas sp.]
MQVLDLYTVGCSLIFIDDQSPKKGGHAKYHEIDVVVSHDENGKAHVRACPDQEGFDPEVDITHCPQDVHEALSGSQFRLQVSLKSDGMIRSHHSWDFDVIDDE